MSMYLIMLTDNKSENLLSEPIPTTQNWLIS